MADKKSDLFRQRAQALRAGIKGNESPSFIQGMYQLADEWDKLATQADKIEQWERGKAPKTPPTH